MENNAACLVNDCWIKYDAISDERDTELYREALICLGKSNTFNNDLRTLSLEWCGKYYREESHIYIFFEKVNLRCGKFVLSGYLSERWYPISEYIINNFNSLHTPFKEYLKDIIKKYATGLTMENVLTYNKNLTIPLIVERLLNVDFIHGRLDELKLLYIERIDKIINIDAIED